MSFLSPEQILLTCQCQFCQYLLKSIKSPWSYLAAAFQCCMGFECMTFCWMTRLEYLSCIMRKPTFCICENKDADQLRGNREADQCLCFRYIDSTILLLSKSGILSLWQNSVAVQPGLCQTRSETTTFFSHYAAHLL